MGHPGHQLKPGCGLSTADAQMPESRAPVRALPPGLCVFQVGSSWRSTQDGGTAQRKKVLSGGARTYGLDSAERRFSPPAIPFPVLPGPVSPQPTLI